jgi:hypothetical protein
LVVVFLLRRRDSNLMVSHKEQRSVNEHGSLFVPDSRTTCAEI